MDTTTITIDLDVPEQEVLYSVTDRVATIMINRPTRGNATNLTLPYSISKGMLRASQDPGVRVIVLTAAGDRAFCAGADRSRLERGRDGGARPVFPPDDPAFVAAIPRIGPSQDDEYRDIRRYGYFMRIPKPIIAAINGAVAGGGLVPALCADIRLAADNAFFTTSFAQRGLIAEHGLSWLLPHLLGPSTALEMFMTSRRVQAQEAKELGLVNHVFSKDTFRDDVQAWAKSLADNSSPRSLAVMKAQVWRAMNQTYNEALAVADHELELSVKSADYMEGVTHFLEKRKPNFPDPSF